MSPRKRGLGINVLAATEQRVAWTFDRFSAVYLSFSGGKDSTVMLHIAASEARKRGRKFGLLFIDLEAQYKLTIDHVTACFNLYADIIDPFWVSLPLHLRNAVSQFEPHWVCWEPERRAEWVREPPPNAITDMAHFPFFRRAMEFEEFVADFGHWYGGKRSTACMVGIRADESLNRFRTLVGPKQRLENKQWTTWKGGSVYNVYPIYDWKDEDLWTFHGVTKTPYNVLYDRMHQAGLTLHQMRICQPYGDDQRKGLWLYHLIEPETWGKVVARVNGANQGALYAGERGNILGNQKINKPAGITWQEFAERLLASMPDRTAEHYRNKIAQFLRWWATKGNFHGGIPEEADPKDEADRSVPSWRRICKALLRNDYWCKGLSFSQTKSDAYEAYERVMKARRTRWGIYG